MVNNAARTLAGAIWTPGWVAADARLTSIHQVRTP
jgi:hypothetical protein